MSVEELSQSQLGSGARQIYHAPGSEPLPRGAVLLTNEEVSRLIMRTIENWMPSHEMWSLKYGSYVLGGVASVGGAIFISHFRQRMLLRNQARLASFLPTVFLPGVVTTLGQHGFVMNRLLTPQDPTQMCPICAELRGITIQVAFGVIQPFLLSIVASSAVAKMTSSYPLPSLLDWKSLSRTYVMLSRPLRPVALMMVVANVVNAAVIVHSQGKAAARIHEKLTENSVFVS